jgi:hypothetical protein
MSSIISWTNPGDKLIEYFCVVGARDDEPLVVAQDGEAMGASSSSSSSSLLRRGLLPRCSVVSTQRLSSHRLFSLGIPMKATTGKVEGPACLLE